MASSRDNIVRPGWSNGDSEHDSQAVDAAGCLDVGVRPRSSSCSQAQKRPSQCGVGVTGNRSTYTSTVHRRQGLSQSSRRPVAVLRISTWGASGAMVFGRGGIQSEQLQVSYYEQYYASIWF